MELVINFSGGKDSTLMLALLCERYPHVKKHVIFADTGWEHVETDKWPSAEAWSREIVSRFGLELHVAKNASKTFLTMAEGRGKFPGMKSRQCTSDLKRDPIHTWIRNNVSDPVIVSAEGIRSEESPKRKAKKRLKRNKRMTNSVRTVWDWAPIKDWKEADVFAELERRGLPVHPVYKFLRRFSCRICIFMTDHDLRQVQENDPGAIAIISQLEEKMNFSIMQRGFLKDIIKTAI